MLEIPLQRSVIKKQQCCMHVSSPPPHSLAGRRENSHAIRPSLRPISPPLRDMSHHSSSFGGGVFHEAHAGESAPTMTSRAEGSCSLVFRMIRR